MVSQKQSKRVLTEVVLIRPFIILCLVFYHCFAIYAGSWDKIPSIGEVDPYYWIVKFISGFQLEGITLVSGYVYAFQILYLKKQQKLSQLVIKKINRLMIPCWIFGVLYYFLITYNPEFSWWQVVLYIMDGAGHLWYLPMLFWCFIMAWGFNHFNLKIEFLLPILAMISIMPCPYVPFGIQRSLHFIFYFMMGFACWMYHDVIQRMLLKIKYILPVMSIYVLLCVLAACIKDHEAYETSFMMKASWHVLNLFVKSSGVMGIFLIAKYLIENKRYSPSSFLLWCSSICYGVYIWHQFLLKWLYYQTDFPVLMGTFLLPWISFFIALLVSVAITVLMLKTKVGRYLLG